MNCTRDGAVVERSWSEWKSRHSNLKAASRSIHNHTAPLQAPVTGWQIYFRTSHYQNNLAAGMGQILLLARFGPGAKFFLHVFNFFLSSLMR